MVTVISRMAHNKGWTDEIAVGWLGSWRQVIPSIDTDRNAVSSVIDMNRFNPYDISKHSLQQSSVTHRLINAIH